MSWKDKLNLLTQLNISFEATSIENRIVLQDHFPKILKEKNLNILSKALILMSTYFGAE